ncbi:Aste57867_24601 [Aphanomyces stellatus]|uniref:Aste57867_24601 protein n=1 Tax=Aphanomyces stellatus TaxID=120398 RepID=A0A485LQX4_9STRA|nr:hypothetical protein As57867_024523 [Aphanomyces stellatus]VFU01239.1 Aste57867_24601 [Aphanomyces stellatus]
MARLRSANALCGLFCMANVFSYLFRSLVPASPVELSAFIQRTLAIPPSRVSFYFGLLESVFIITFSISIVVFGYLSKTMRPFRLLSIGLILWVVSSLLCGLAAPANNFYILLIGRLLSGIGDSAITGLATPFIERHAFPDRKNLWMGLFYGAIPIGTSLSYFLGSLVTRTLGWQWTFYIVAGLMTPLAFLSLFCVPDDWNVPLASDSTSSFVTDICTVLQSPVFLTSSLGGAAFAFTFISCATFAPAILIGAQTFPAAWSATIFGLCVLVCGVVGSVCGGLFLDHSCRQAKVNDRCHRLAMASRQQLLFIVLGQPCLLLTTLCLRTPLAFLVCLAIGLAAAFATLNATTVTILLSVPPALQGLAIGLFSNILHVAGDVPAPIVVGLIKDAYAPGCGSVQGPDGLDTLDPACFSDANFFGLKMTLFWSMLWLVWAIVFWGATWWYATRQERTTEANDVYLQVHDRVELA